MISIILQMALMVLLIGAVWVVVGRMLVRLLRALLDEPQSPERNGREH